MPRQVTAYVCAFKCGRRATLNPKPIEGHEKTCALNPARRACKTCKHNDAFNYECRIDELPSGVAMAVNCPSWEAK